jgi:hypothetical protein
MSPDENPVGPGIGVDASGGPVVDPTKNVLDLVAAAIKRQDDLREADEKRQNDLRAAEGAHVREVLQLRSELGEQERECAKETAGLRAEHNQQLREAEAARINAIRSVDVEAVQRAAEVQATQASTLAAQVATSAETLRTQVAAAANAATIALAAALEPIIKDIADLRRAQYEAQGQKTQVVETRQSAISANAIIGSIIGAAGLIAAVIAVAVR